MIACTGVSKTYRGVTVVQPLDLTIAGGICAVLGANGAGKSTLLKMMTGLVKPDTGSVTVAGLDVTSQAAKRIIGVLPEELGLFEPLSIEENLQLVGPIYGLSAQEVKERSAQLLEFLGLTDRRSTFVSECSYGMRKKTALAMALLHNPKALFLDEPFEGLDPSASLAVQQMLQRLAERGTTVVLTSHILPVVERLASRVLMLQRGVLVWDSEREAQRFRPETYFEFVDAIDVKDMPWLG